MLSHRHADRQDGWQLWKRVSNGKNAVSWLLQIIAARRQTHSLEAHFTGRCYCGARVIWVWRLTLLSSRNAHGFRLKNYLTRSEEAYQNWRSASFPYLCCSRRNQPVRTVLARDERFKLHFIAFCPRVSFFPLYLSLRTAEKTVGETAVSVILGHSHSPWDTHVREPRKALQLRSEESSHLNRSLKDTAGFLDKAAMTGALAARQTKASRELI